MNIKFESDRISPSIHAPRPSCDSTEVDMRGTSSTKSIPRNLPIAWLHHAFLSKKAHILTPLFAFLSTDCYAKKTKFVETPVQGGNGPPGSKSKSTKKTPVTYTASAICKVSSCKPVPFSTGGGNGATGDKPCKVFKSTTDSTNPYGTCWARAINPAHSLK